MSGDKTSVLLLHLLFLVSLPYFERKVKENLRLNGTALLILVETGTKKADNAHPRITHESMKDDATRDTGKKYDATGSQNT
jgi:hypothetical protein